MSDPMWKQQSQAEKIEDLRRDVTRLFDAMNNGAASVQQIRKLANENHALLSEVAKAVENLERRLPKAPKPKKSG